MEHIKDNNTKINSKDIIFLILAGGKSIRMESPKALLKYKNKTFLEIIYNICQTTNIPTYISLANKDQLKYLENINIEEDKILFDNILDIGPLGALNGAFTQVNTKRIFLISTDTPKITIEQIRYMLSFTLEYKDCSIITKSNNYIHPCFSIYNRNSLPYLNQTIENKNYKLKGLVNTINKVEVDITNTIFKNNLLNINTKEDYQKLLGPFTFCISGFKNSYKTTLITKLIPYFIKDNYKFAIIKHDGHDYELKENTDTYKYYESKAEEFIIFSNNKYTHTEVGEFSVQNYIEQNKHLDFIIIEGLKNEDYPKILIKSTEYKKQEYKNISNVFLNIPKEKIVKTEGSKNNSNKNNSNKNNSDKEDNILDVYEKIKEMRDARFF